MNTRMSSAVLTVAVTASVLSGCASSKRGLEPRDYWPSGARWKHAASRALMDRGTWIPLAGAAVVSIDDWDREISDWAVGNTPIFGSGENARQASDTFWIATQLSMAGTALTVANGDGPWHRKAERLVIEELSVLLTAGTTSAIKSLVDRERPDRSNDRSSPSGHASQSFTMARMACLNVDDLGGLSRGWRITLKTTFTTFAAATAWSRVEGGKHYPSDVLVGAALGNFVAVFVHDAFLSADSRVRFGATLGRSELSFSVGLSF
jgi:membrane-associated phospholipid phosphatase